jgi:hypothetical protein
MRNPWALIRRVAFRPGAQDELSASNIPAKIGRREIAMIVTGLRDKVFSMFALRGEHAQRKESDIPASCLCRLPFECVLDARTGDHGHNFRNSSRRKQRHGRRRNLSLRKGSTIDAAAANSLNRTSAQRIPSRPGALCSNKGRIHLRRPSCLSFSLATTRRTIHSG